jgi:hypothetical protein
MPSAHFKLVMAMSAVTKSMAAARSGGQWI